MWISRRLGFVTSQTAISPSKAGAIVAGQRTGAAAGAQPPGKFDRPSADENNVRSWHEAVSTPCLPERLLEDDQ